MNLWFHDENLEVVLTESSLYTAIRATDDFSQGNLTDISQVVGCEVKLWTLWILLFNAFKFFCKNKCTVTPAA